MFLLENKAWVLWVRLLLSWVRDVGQCVLELRDVVPVADLHGEVELGCHGLADAGNKRLVVRLP